MVLVLLLNQMQCIVIILCSMFSDILLSNKSVKSVNTNNNVTIFRPCTTNRLPGEIFVNYNLPKPTLYEIQNDHVGPLATWALLSYSHVNYIRYSIIVSIPIVQTQRAIKRGMISIRIQIFV